VKNDYQLLFRHRLGFPTIAYFIARVSTLACAVVIIIFLNAPSIDCKAIEMTVILLFIVGNTFTMLLSYIRVCAVWRWNRFIVGFFGVLWLSTVASSFTMLRTNKAIQVPGELYCTLVTIVDSGPIFLTPWISVFVNQTAIFLAITYGVCKNTLGGDLTFRDGIPLMLGKGLPTFSRALIHDSQICNIVIMSSCATTLPWVYSWSTIQPTSAFRLALVAPFISTITILICRVHRNTKLGLYSKVVLPFNDPKLQTRAAKKGMVPRNVHSAEMPIQISLTHVDEHRGDFHTKPRSSVPDTLDFGIV